MPALVELPLPNASPFSLLRPSPQLCVVVDRHFRVEIEKGFDPETFEQVVRVFESLGLHAARRSLRIGLAPYLRETSHEK